MSDTAAGILAQAEEYERALPGAPRAIPAPVGAELARWIDHTLLKPEATAAQIGKLCDEARQANFATVCVNPSFVPLAARALAGSGTAVCTVCAFPLGASLPELKAAEARGLMERGAAEVDMVINIGALKSRDISLALEDVRAVAEALAGKARLKVILEMALLTQTEKIIGCLVCKSAGADFVKTSTGFAQSGATVEDVELMRRVVGAQMGVKADAKAMIAAGASRIGTSGGVSILQEALQGAAA